MSSRMHLLISGLRTYYGYFHAIFGDSCIESLQIS